MIDLQSLSSRAWSAFRRLQRTAVDQRRGKLARVVEVHAFSIAVKLAVVEFSGKTLLLSVGKNGISLIAEGRGE
ncbi:hypothetical protein D3Y57_04210 (plasmid) [Sphingomonas paeninsulae]|uniref:Uncharacterized protein n=1 Tax=Sphingomonas paeninsulae TaxID=2319844 RepID=A0A494THB7_SPHPE|nr:hypothetical protein D3Y57_04210 [Sphingomonas paeninsulae]